MPCATPSRVRRDRSGAALFAAQRARLRRRHAPRRRRNLRPGAAAGLPVGDRSPRRCAMPARTGRSWPRRRRRRICSMRWNRRCGDAIVIASTVRRRRDSLAMRSNPARASGQLRLRQLRWLSDCSSRLPARAGLLRFARNDGICYTRALDIGTVRSMTNDRKDEAPAGSAEEWPKRAPPTIDLDASDVSGDTQASAGAERGGIVLSAHRGRRTSRVLPVLAALVAPWRRVAALARAGRVLGRRADRPAASRPACGVADAVRQRRGQCRRPHRARCACRIGGGEIAAARAGA